MATKNTFGIKVFSEIGKLKEVIVQRPGAELENFDINKRSHFLMDGDLDYIQAGKEHDEFVKILKKNNVKVHLMENLFIETWKKIDKNKKLNFIKKFVLETKIKQPNYSQKITNFLLKLSNNPKLLIRKLIEGISYLDLMKGGKKDYITEPLDNIYFQRDGYASIGNNVSIHHMKYNIRNRETLIYELVFSNHPKFFNTKQVYSRNSKLSLEGGDVFPYTKETLVVGVSERTTLKAIANLAKNMIKEQTKFKQIIAINVPKTGRLMHLDTWLTMLDKNKFLYSPIAVKSFKFWKINLESKTVKVEAILNKNLKQVLEMIIKRKPILIPVAGNYSSNDVKRETKYDGTNFLVLRPGVVVGFDRNRHTIDALKKAGITVYSFTGDELSLGEGNARCMSMPIIREDY